MKYKLIAFDIDGTLAPSGKTLGEKEGVLQMISEKECYRRKKEFPYLPYPQVNETLKKLRKEAKLVIISNGNGNLQRNKLSILKIRHYFTSLLISENVCREIYGTIEKLNEVEKPNKFMFEKVCQEGGVNPRECLYIGNRDSDYMGARNAGWDFLRIVDHRFRMGLEGQIAIDKDEFMKIMEYL